MDVRIMEYMLMIEQEKSLSKAAEKLNISQSALSQTLSKLEKSFKTPLFVRANRQMVPTRIGQIYLDGARDMMKVKNDTYDSIHALRVNGTKHISISAESQVYLLLEKELMPSLKDRYPGQEFRLLPGDSRIAKEYLLNHIVDAAFLCSRRCSNSMLNYHHLYDEHLVLCIPDSLTRAYEELLQNPGRRGLPFILPRAELYFRLPLENIIQKLSFSISRSYETEDFLTMKRLMEQGFGAALLPERMARNTSGCTVHPIHEKFSFELYFAVPKYQEETPEFHYILKRAKSLFSR